MGWTIVYESPGKEFSSTSIVFRSFHQAKNVLSVVPVKFWISPFCHLCHIHCGKQLPENHHTIILINHETVHFPALIFKGIQTVL